MFCGELKASTEMIKGELMSSFHGMTPSAASYEDTDLEKQAPDLLRPTSEPLVGSPN